MAGGPLLRRGNDGIPRWGSVLGTTATEDEAWEIYDQWPKTDCKCGCRGIVTRDGSPQKVLDD